MDMDLSRPVEVLQDIIQSVMPTDDSPKPADNEYRAAFLTQLLKEQRRKSFEQVNALFDLCGIAGDGVIYVARKGTEYRFIHSSLTDTLWDVMTQEQQEGTNEETPRPRPTDGTV